MQNKFTYPKSEVGKRLKKFIVENYGEIKIFSEKFNIPTSTLSLYINGKRDPGAEQLSKIYNSGCDLNWLMDGEGDMYAGNEAGMYLAEQHGYQKQKDKTEEMYDMIKETNRLLKEGLIRDYGKKAAANSKYGDKDFQE